MRLPIIIAAVSAIAPAAAYAHSAAQGPPEQVDIEGERFGQVLVREADGSITIRSALQAYSEQLDATSSLSFRTDGPDAVAPTPLGRRRSPSEQAVDEDLEQAFEEAMDMARFGAPD